MTFRTFATFNASFPDDAQWDESGMPLIPGGNAVASTLRKALERCGTYCTDVVQQIFYGWRFDLEIQGMGLTVIVQSFEDGQWLLICERRKSTWRRMFSRKDDCQLAVDATTTIHEVLNSDSRFSNVRWHHREEFEKGDGLGFVTPT